MALFQEVDLTTFAGGQITAVSTDSLAAKLGIQPGDELLAINDNKVEDIIDVQYYGADEALELLVRRGEEYLLYEAERAYEQELGFSFAHPTFDTDIRRCNNLCEFCFVLQMAPKFRRTLYIKDDDYRYSFLFGHYVTLTNLSEHDWWRIETMGLSPLYVSVHVTDLEARRAYLRNKTAPDIMEQLRWLGKHNIKVHTQLVVTPGVNDGELMRKSIADLASMHPTVQTVSVVPVGLTKQHKYKLRTHTTEEAAEVLAYVQELQADFQAQFGYRFAYPTDEWFLVTGQTLPQIEEYDGHQLHENGLGMVRQFLDEWEGVKAEIESASSDSIRFKAVTLATGAMFAKTLREKAIEFSKMTGVKTAVIPIDNVRLGGTITAAGLLMAQDILAQLKTAQLGELIVLPRVVFDHPDIVSLDDLTPQDVANQLQKRVALADTMGDVWDAIIGDSLVTYEPSQKPAADVIPLSVIDPNENNSHFS